MRQQQPEAVARCRDLSEALSKFDVLVDYEYRNSIPTFLGMPDMFREMQQMNPQRVMHDMRSHDKEMTWNMSHSKALHDGTAEKYCRLAGYDSQFRKEWPDYRQSPFSLACAFDRAEIVRALVVQFGCDCPMEHGLVLIAENGLEREWQMTGLDIAVEFGCVATFDLLCELGEAHPHAIKSIEYADVSHEDCRVLCMRNMGN